MTDQELLKKIQTKLEEVHVAVLGNGDPDKALVTRVMVCEGKLKMVLAIGAFLIGTLIAGAIGMALN